MCRGKGSNAVVSGEYRSTASLKAQFSSKELMISPANGRSLEQEDDSGYHRLQREQGIRPRIPCITIGFRYSPMVCRSRCLLPQLSPKVA